MSQQDELYALGYTWAEANKIINDEENAKRDAQLEAEE